MVTVCNGWGGGISLRGATPLAFIRGSVNTEKYIEILDEHLFSTMDFLYSDSSDGWKFQQDNASCHTSVKAKEYFEKIALIVIEWPANSPDLNPIENIWKLVKDMLEKENLKSIHEWIAKINEFWKNISHDYLKSLIDSMKTRIDLCLAANGAHIKY
jgi:hypothetical protein